MIDHGCLKWWFWFDSKVCWFRLQPASAVNESARHILFVEAAVRSFPVVRTPTPKLSRAVRWSCQCLLGFEPERSVHSSSSEWPKSPLEYICDECLLGLVDLVWRVDVQILNPVLILPGNVLYWNLVHSRHVCALVMLQNLIAYLLIELTPARHQ